MCMYVCIYNVRMFVYIYACVPIYSFLFIHLRTYMCTANYSIQVDKFYYSVNCHTSPKSTVP